MNPISSIFWIGRILSILIIIECESLGDEIIEKFYWTPKNDSRDVQWEFFVIGRRVPWNVAKVMCTNRDSVRSSNVDSLDPENILSYANLSGIRRDTEILPESRLAVLEEDKAKIWLSRMLSESDYRYDGLWVGGHRTNFSVNWTWIGSEEDEEIAIPSSPIIGNYPEWYKSDDSQEIEKNCLLFDRVGHDMPILVPSNCNQRKPFVCSRVVRKKSPDRIVEGIGVYVDGYRYTVYSVDSDDDNGKEMENTSGVRKLNGGGVKWRDARVECRKRGKYLATVLSIEAAAGIASIMLKNRPSMESAWLGGWSIDGTEWTWSPTGFILSSTKSATSQYPPWLSGHPVTASNLNDFSRRRGRCLILDRHLCPDHISPVFLDLDCEKKRPFVCQDAMPRRSALGNRAAPVNRSITAASRLLKFSADRMTWNEGRQYCAQTFGRIASILDSKTLSAVLDKMSDLYIDHIWVGGRTEKTSEGWKWFDETGKALSRKGIGAGSSWCLGDDDGSWPRADADSCLNLDREGYGLPLFYGLRCDFAKQHVLCSMDHGSRSLSTSVTGGGTKEAKIDRGEGGKFATGGRRSFGSGLNIPSRSNNTGNGLKIMQTKDIEKNRSDRFSHSVDKEDSSSKFEVPETTTLTYDNDNFKFFEDDKGLPTINSPKAKKSNKGIKIGDLDEETKRMLVANGYNFTDNDMILVNSLKSDAITEITELSSCLIERIRDLASYERSAIIFVLDDSSNVLNAWFAEELKFVAIILRNLFPLSSEHPMGLLSLSQSSRLSLPLNQTNVCSVITHLAGRILENRGTRRNANNNNYKNIREAGDFIRAASAAVDIVRNSVLRRVTIVFIVDGENTIMNDGSNSKRREDLIKKLKILRNSDHEAFALFIGERLGTFKSYSVIPELFGDSSYGKKNVYFAKSFSQLAKLVSVINSTTSRADKNLQCDQPHWIVPPNF